MKLEPQLRCDVGIGALLMRQTDIKAYAPAAGVGRASIRRFHNAAPTAGTHERARFLIVASQGSVLLQSGGPKENDGVLDLLAAKGVERLQVFGENSQRPRRIAADEYLIKIRDPRFVVLCGHNHFLPA